MPLTNLTFMYCRTNRELVLSEVLPSSVTFCHSDALEEYQWHAAAFCKWSTAAIIHNIIRNFYCLPLMYVKHSIPCWKYPASSELLVSTLGCWNMAVINHVWLRLGLNPSLLRPWSAAHFTWDSYFVTGIVEHENASFYFINWNMNFHRRWFVYRKISC